MSNPVVEVADGEGSSLSDGGLLTKERAGRLRYRMPNLVMIRTHPFLAPFAVLLAATLSPLAVAKNQDEIPLSARGTALHEKPAKELESLRAEVAAALPPVDEAKKAGFLELRAKWNGIPRTNDETPPAERKANDELRAQAESAAMDAAGALLADLAPILSSTAHDPKLMRIAVLAHATPRGLAEFAQQGTEQEQLLGQFFADEALMRQVIEAGGANGGAYGGMMEVYTAILAKSERAR